MNWLSDRASRGTLAVLILLLAGCAAPKIHWGERVGSFTLDQAVLELGPPNQDAKLSDGRVVAEWLTSRGFRQMTATGVYASPWHYDPYPASYLETTTPDRYLRLTFDTNAVLQAWKHIYR